MLIDGGQIMGGQRMVMAVAVLGIAGVTVTGCARDQQSWNPPPTNLTQILRDEGAVAVPRSMLRADGSLKNGLLPEQWGDTH
jgi:hypothetical protein